jgi:hypothetical protein
MAEGICHDALSSRASTFGRGSFLFIIAKLPVVWRVVALQIAMMTTTAIFTLAFFLLETCSNSNMRWLSSIEEQHAG